MSDVVQKPTKVSREGVILIKSFEGFRPRAVQRNDGRWMIGYGHTQSAREGLTISESDAELLLQHDLIPVVRAVKAIQTPLNQHQFDSIASFAFSVGVERFKTSDVLARLNAGAPAEAADAMTGWADDAAAEGPPRRRAAERALFFARPGAAVALADLLAAPVPHLPHVVRFDAAPATLVSTPLALSSDTPQAAAFPLDEAASHAPGSIISAAAEDVAPFPLDPDAPAPTPVEEETASNPAEPAPLAIDPVEASAISTKSAFHSYSPFGQKVVGPLPHFDQPSGILAGDPSGVPPTVKDEAAAPHLVAANDVQNAVTAQAASTSDDTLNSFQNAVEGQSPIVASPLASLDSPALALTAPDDAETSTGGQAARFDPAAQAAAPKSPERPYNPRKALPRRSGLGETWTFLAMGGLGLIALGTAIAAFRRASVTQARDSATIGWVLALIAVACVGVAGWNLYQRWGRAERR